MRMKKLLSTILCLLVLSPALSRAETITHDFSEMAGTPQLYIIPPSNIVGETDLVTYTCSGGSNAKFVNVNGITSIYLKDRYDQVVTSPAIERLDSLYIQYDPAESVRTLKAYTSVDNVNWTEVTVKRPNKGTWTIQLPATGDYYMKFANESTSNSFYIRQIKYTTKPCVCLKVVSE